MTLQAHNMPPITATWEQFHNIFGPITAGYPWGEDTIKDLWLMGSPQPHDPSKRLVMPRQYIEWITDVLQRQGRPLDDSAKLYAQFTGG